MWFLADERKENVHIDVFEDETVVMGIGKNNYSFKHCAENIITEIALHLAYTARQVQLPNVMLGKIKK